MVTEHIGRPDFPPLPSALAELDAELELLETSGALESWLDLLEELLDVFVTRKGPDSSSLAVSWLVTKILESLLGEANSFCRRFRLGFGSWVEGTSKVLIVILVGLSDWLTWCIFFWVLAPAVGDPFVLSGEVNRSSWVLSKPRQLYSLKWTWKDENHIDCWMSVRDIFFVMQYYPIISCHFIGKYYDLIWLDRLLQFAILISRFIYFFDRYRWLNHATNLL